MLDNVGVNPVTLFPALPMSYNTSRSFPENGIFIVTLPCISSAPRALWTMLLPSCMLPVGTACMVEPRPRNSTLYRTIDDLKSALCLATTLRMLPEFKRMCQNQTKKYTGQSTQNTTSLTTSITYVQPLPVHAGKLVVISSRPRAWRLNAEESKKNSLVSNNKIRQNTTCELTAQHLQPLLFQTLFNLHNLHQCYVLLCPERVHFLES